MTLEIVIRPTDQVVRASPTLSQGEVFFRVWNGHTGRGVPIYALVRAAPGQERESLADHERRERHDSILCPYPWALWPTMHFSRSGGRPIGRLWVGRTTSPVHVAPSLVIASIAVETGDDASELATLLEQSGDDFRGVALVPRPRT